MTTSYGPGWARLDLLGHQTEFGYVYPVEMAPGQWMLALQVPGPKPEDATERYVGFAAVYQIVPTTEAEVRASLGLDRCHELVDGSPCSLDVGHDGDHDHGLPF